MENNLIVILKISTKSYNETLMIITRVISNVMIFVIVFWTFEAFLTFVTWSIFRLILKPSHLWTLLKTPSTHFYRMFTFFNIVSMMLVVIQAYSLIAHFIFFAKCKFSWIVLVLCKCFVQNSKLLAFQQIQLHLHQHLIQVKCFTST
jgi:hypothetical protein